MIWLAGIALFLCAATCAVLNFYPSFSGEPDEQSMARIKNSLAWDGRRFVNPEPTVIQTGDNMPSLGEWVLTMISPPAGKNPSAPLPGVKYDAAALQNAKFAWFGHSTVIFKLDDKVILTDPVFYRASPLPIGGAPFEYEQTPMISQLPHIDAVLISHDHYDHLDYKAIRELDDIVGLYLVPLGVRAHLLRWGVLDDKIIEFDLRQSESIGGLKFTLEPARHFSGRRLNSDNPTLWGSWVVQAPGFSVFFGGDSGYGAHYGPIAEKYGEFDLVMLENGAYDESWAQIHAFPE